MKKARLLGAVCACVVVLVSLPISAASVVSSDFRSVAAFADAGPDTQGAEVIRPPGLNPWVESTNAFAFWCDPFPTSCADASSVARQSSDVASDGELFIASGDASADAFSSDSLFFAESLAETRFEVSFTLDAPYNYDLSGLVDGNSSVTLFNDTLTAVLFHEAPFGGSFSDSGVLQPGEYTIQAIASAHAYAPDIFDLSTYLGEFSLDMSLTQVPIPAAVWLFGSGLLGLIGIARRKRAA